MLVTKVTIHSTPVIRASLRALGSDGGPSAPPLERCDDDMGIPAPLCNEGADPARGRHTREAAREAGPQGPPRRMWRRGALLTYTGRKKKRTFFSGIQPRGGWGRVHGPIDPVVDRLDVDRSVRPDMDDGRAGLGTRAPGVPRVQARRARDRRGAGPQRLVCGVPATQDAARRAGAWCATRTADPLTSRAETGAGRGAATPAVHPGARPPAGRSTSARSIPA